MNNFIHKKNSLLVLISSFLFLVQCNSNYTSKKTGYFKIPLPQHKYQPFKDSTFPYSFEYPVSINGKMRLKLELPLDMPKEQVEQHVMALDTLTKYTDGKQVKKVIVVHGKIVNVVV